MDSVLYLGSIDIDAPSLAEVCRRYGVRQLSLFGSAVGGEMCPESDIDIMVEFEPAVRIGVDQVRIPRRRIGVVGWAQSRLGYQARTEALDTPTGSQRCPRHLCGMRPHS